MGFGFDDADGESAEPGDIFWTVASADPTAIFIVVPIDDVVTAILDGPVAAIHVEETLWIRLLCRSTGDAVSDFKRADAALFLCRMPFDEERLSDVRKVKVAVQFGGGPDLSDFDSSMVGGRILNEIRLLPVLEQQGEVLQNAALVSFDGEMIMGMTLLDQVLGYLALGQQSIGRHILALNIDGIKQWDSHFDLVGAFEFFMVFYGQGTDFFWV